MVDKIGLFGAGDFIVVACEREASGASLTLEVRIVGGSEGGAVFDWVAEEGKGESHEGGHGQFGMHGWRSLGDVLEAL